MSKENALYDAIAEASLPEDVAADLRAKARDAIRDAYEQGCNDSGTVVPLLPDRGQDSPKRGWVLRGTRKLFVNKG